MNKPSQKYTDSVTKGVVIWITVCQSYFRFISRFISRFPTVLPLFPFLSLDYIQHILTQQVLYWHAPLEALQVTIMFS